MVHILSLLETNNRTDTKNLHPAALSNKGTVWRGLFDFQLH